MLVLACDVMNASKEGGGGRLRQGVQHKITSLQYILGVIDSEGIERAGGQMRQNHTGLGIFS